MYIHNIVYVSFHFPFQHFLFQHFHPLPSSPKTIDLQGARQHRELWRLPRYCSARARASGKYSVQVLQVPWEKKSWQVEFLGCPKCSTNWWIGGVFLQNKLKRSRWGIWNFKFIIEDRVPFHAGQRQLQPTQTAWSVAVADCQQHENLLRFVCETEFMLKSIYCTHYWSPTIRESELKQFHKDNPNPSWWLNQPIWKICLSNWKSSSPNFQGENDKKYVWVATT